MHDIFLVLILIYCLGLLTNTCIQPREPTRHLNPYLGESRGVSPEPFTGNSATLLCYTWCLVQEFSLGYNYFYFRIIWHLVTIRLAITYSPPYR